MDTQDNQKPAGSVNGADRRRSQRFDTKLAIKIRLQPDGSPVDGSALDIGPNGMRILTAVPLLEGQYVHISFENASNNTFAEGRAVWVERRDARMFECGIDIQRWGGGTPGSDFAHFIEPLKEKKDRRKKPR